MLLPAGERSTHHHNMYGATEAIIIKGQSQAKTRVIIFLTVFLASGFFSELLDSWGSRGWLHWLHLQLPF